MVPSQVPPAKSELALQLEAYEKKKCVPGIDEEIATERGDGMNYSTKEFNATSNHANTQCDSPFLHNISRMISCEQWDDLDGFLSSPAEMAACLPGLNHTNVSLSSLDMACLGSNCLNLTEVVHFACKFNPPLRIIQLLLSLYHKGSCKRDKMGRLPLHYAAKWNASYNVIAYLVKANPMAASVRDKNGKTPLHHLCETYCSSVGLDSRECLSAEDNFAESLEILMRAAPGTVNAEDNGGTTVIEYAICLMRPFLLLDEFRKHQSFTGRLTRKQALQAKEATLKLPRSSSENSML